MNFSYVALNKDNKKIEGNIVAADMSAARKTLHGMGFSVLAIDETKKEELDKLKPEIEKDYLSFEFKAIDLKGKEIVGTIDAVDGLKAYSRLVEEFHFEVIYLFDLSVDPTEQEKQKEDLVQSLKEKYTLLNPEQKTKDSVSSEDELESLEKNSFQKLDVLRSQIDVMVAMLNGLIKKIPEDQQKNAKVLSLKSLVDEMERVKMSNNVKYTRILANRILDAAEELFKDKAEYSLVIKQRKSLNDTGKDKLKQMYYSNAADLNGISGVLNKVSGLLKVYAKKIGIIEGDEAEGLLKLNKREEGLKQDLNPKQFKTVTLYELEDLLTLDQGNLKAKLLEEVKMLFSLQKIPSSERRIAWLNIKNLSKVYWNSPKIKKSLEKGDTLTYEESSFKPDYENIFREINLFLGWLLCFYIVFYYIGGIVLQKNLVFLSNFMYKTVTVDFLLFFVFFIFIFNLLIKLKIRFLKQNFLGGTFLFLCGILLVMVYVLNY